MDRVTPNTSSVETFIAERIHGYYFGVICYLPLCCTKGRLHMFSKLLQPLEDKFLQFLVGRNSNLRLIILDLPCLRQLGVVLESSLCCFSVIVRSVASFFSVCPRFIFPLPLFLLAPHLFYCSILFFGFPFCCFFLLRILF